MARGSIGSADTTSMNTNDFDDSDQSFTRSVDDHINVPQATANETTYQAEFLKWKRYYNKIAELRAVIDSKAMWTVGNGFTASGSVSKILKRFTGNGKQTFNLILNNLVRTYTVGGDAYAEIVRNKSGRVINLKPLAPETIKVIATKKGIITRYEQWDDTSSKKPSATWKPEEMFHLMWQNLDGEIHGRGTVEQCKDIIDARNESFRDMRTVFHRYVKPLLVISVDSDDTTELTAFKQKMDKAVKLGENMIIPRDVVDNIERVAIPQFATLDPLPWIQMLMQQFLIAEGVPEVIMGMGKDTTEASSKILYLAFQQMVEFNQQFLEENIESQLGLKIELEFPRDIIGNLLTDESKDSSLGGERESEFNPSSGK